MSIYSNNENTESFMQKIIENLKEKYIVTSSEVSTWIVIKNAEEKNIRNDIYNILQKATSSKTAKEFMLYLITVPQDDDVIIYYEK